MNKLITLFAIFLSINVNAQVENGLQFDGTDDKIEVANASALIANSTSISMTCWVNPQNPAPAFPDMDGFCGFRNDADADFYLVQTDASHVEARFRNNAGASFDISSTSIQYNVWQHYALTYDGSYMRLYYNGVLSDSVAATGVISSTTEILNIGNILYSFTDFFLQGTLDEVSLWNTTLQPAEIECIYKSYIDSTSAGLQLYYKFNQGIAAGSNVGQDTLNPSTGNLFGELSGFTYSGSTSNWVQGKHNFSSTVDVICPGNTIIFGTQTLTEPGLYYESYTDSSGCDSVAQLILYPVLTDSVAFFPDSMVAVQINAIYQWYDCALDTIIPGETFQFFTPAQNGLYSVIVTYNNCTDTSDCFNWTTTGIEKNSRLNITIYPNPVEDVLSLSFVLNNAMIEITDPAGKLISKKNNFSGKSIDVAKLQRGIYFIKILEKGKSAIFKILKLS